MDDSPQFDKHMRPLPFFVGRPLVCATICFGAGTVLGALRPFHWLWMAGLFAACLMAIVWYLSGRKTALGILPAFFFLGLVLASVSANPVRPAEGRYAVSGSVFGQVRIKESGQVSCTLSQVCLDGRDVYGNVYWSFYLKEGESPPALANGSHVIFSGRLYHPAGQQNPYGFDFDLYLKQQGTYACLYGRDDLSIAPSKGMLDGSLAFRIRNALTQSLYATMGQQASLASLMLLGAANQLPEESREDFRITGTAHVLSISGLHIAYLAGMVIWLLKKLKVRPKARFLIVASFLAVYSWITGLSAPVLRSSLMLLVFMGAQLSGRPHDPLTSISAAFFALLMVKPLDIFSPGFQLSFGAVTGMLILGQPLLAWQNRLSPEKKKRIHGRFRQWMDKQWKSLKTLPALGITAQLGVALPLAACYHSISLLGIFVNLLVIPYVALLMLFFLLALALSPLGAVGQAAGTLAGWLSDILLNLVRLAADVPGMAAKVPSPSWPMIVGGSTFLILLSPYVLFRGKRRLLLLAAAAVFALGGSMALQNRDVRYTQLSVGNADAAILEDGAYTAVIDTGETGAEAADYLAAEGRSVDALFLTHLHKDHAGGVERLLKDGIQIRQVYLPEGAEDSLADAEGLAALQAIRANNIPIQALHDGDTLSSLRTQMTVLWPAAGTVRKNQDPNQYPLVIRLQMEDVSLLLAGDITGEYENYAAAPADILKAAHHGSAGSTGEDFLNVVRPQTALLSCSGMESLPSPKTVERLANRNIPVYRTDQSGAITLLIHQNTWRVIPFRKGAAP